MNSQLTPAQATPARIARQPALDGVRAVAVTMVLLFHGKLSWTGGGYLGVSMFFTLSGFLITSLLVREFEANARIAPMAFYARRLRRLLPASLACLSVVSILAAFDVWSGVDHLRRDVTGALFQVANWVQLFAGESYTDLQSENAGIVSPLDHYWSLAIEEQFYWIWPLAFWGLARLARHRGWSMTAVVGSLTVCFSVAAPIIAAVWGRDAAYWATPARAGEILLGAGLAVALAAGRLRPQRWMAPTAAVVVLGSAAVLPAAGGPAYHGAFPLLAVATAVLLLGLQRPGPITSALSTRPLVALGKVSYGVYLYHFPIFVLMSSARVGRSGVTLLVGQLGVTLVVAVISYGLIERPIRFGRVSGVRTAIWSGFATAGVLGLALAIPPARTATYYAPDTELAARAGIQPLPDPAPLGATGAPLTTVALPPAGAGGVANDDPVDPAGSVANVAPVADVAPMADAALVADAAPVAVIDANTTALPLTPVLERPARILVVGDSTAEATGAGLVAWAVEHSDVAQVSLAVSAGCGFVRGGVVPSDNGVPFQRNCDDLLDKTLPEALVHLQPDVVMLLVTARDVVPRQWNDEDGLITPLHPHYVGRMRSDYQAVTDLIRSATTARIVWVRPPTVNPYWLGDPHPFLDPALHEIREGIVADTVAANADRSQFLDLRTWMEADGIAADHDARPDGWHLDAASALYVADTWLGPQLAAAAAENALTQAATPAPSPGEEAGGPLQ